MSSLKPGRNHSRKGFSYEIEVGDLYEHTRLGTVGGVFGR